MKSVKVKTFRNLFFVAVAAYIALRYHSPFSVDDIFFKNSENTIYEFWGLWEYVVYCLAIPFFVDAVVFFRHNKYLMMTKRGIAYYCLGLAILIILPFAEYPSRTEITAETITKHNLIGQVTEVYRFEDAEKVTAGLKANASVHKWGATAYLDFIYSVEFEDGYSYDFGNPCDDELWNRIIDGVDSTVKEKGIEKNVIGDVYIRGNVPLYIYENYHDSIRPYLPKIETLMYGKVISEEFVFEEAWDDTDEPTYYNFLQ